MSQLDALTAFFQLDLPELIAGILVLLAATLSSVQLIGKFSELIGRPLRWIRKKNEDHELLLNTAKTLAAFMDEIKITMENTQDEVKQYSVHRTHDRNQSFRIQKELTDSITAIKESNAERDLHLDALITAQRECLADKINSKYKTYIALKGIPADEVDEFTNLHTAYKILNGNHSGDAKYHYVMEHLPVIPVEVNLLTDHSPMDPHTL